MGDKSPKSKDRNQKQKSAEKTGKVANAKSKQDSFNKTTQTASGGKGKK